MSKSKGPYHPFDPMHGDDRKPGDLLREARDGILVLIAFGVLLYLLANCSSWWGQLPPP